MTDTSPEILKKQFEIIYSKPQGERFKMQLEMMDYAVLQTKRLLRQWHPHLSERELVIEFFKLYYHDDFPKEEMERIVDWMRDASSVSK